MILLAIELDQFRLKVVTDCCEDSPQVIKNLFGEYTASVFGDKD